MERDRLTLRDASGREYRVQVSGDTVTVDGVAVTVRPAADGSLHIPDARNPQAWAIPAGETIWVFLDGATYTFTRAEAAPRRAAAHHGSLTAPMPGTVRQVAVAVGDAVQQADVLVVLEAMKMELPIRATASGIVTAINCREGELVQPGQPLVEIDGQ